CAIGVEGSGASGGETRAFAWRMSPCASAVPAERNRDGGASATSLRSITSRLLAKISSCIDFNTQNNVTVQGMRRDSNPSGSSGAGGNLASAADGWIRAGIANEMPGG